MGWYRGMGVEGRGEGRGIFCSGLHKMEKPFLENGISETEFISLSIMLWRLLYRGVPPVMKTLACSRAKIFAIGESLLIICAFLNFTWAHIHSPQQNIT